MAEGSADETYPLLPNSPYAASKAASDLLARSYFITHGLDVRTTRCCNNYGKNQYPEKLVPVIISKIKKGEPLPIYGSGENIREWIHVSEHCRAIQLILDHGKAGEIYNIGSGLELKNLELVKILLELTGGKESTIDFVKDRLGHDLRYSINNRKIRNMGFEPHIELREGLGDLIALED